MTEENKPSWKEKEKVAPRVKEGISKNAFLQSREATKVSKKALKTAKKEYKFSRKNYKVEKKNFRRLRKQGDKPLSINHVIAKKKFIEGKNGKKVAKRVYQKTKAQDRSRISVQLKSDIKLSGKQELRQHAVKALGEDDTLSEGTEAYRKYQKTKQNMRVGLNISKNAGKIVSKTGKSTYGVGNRFFNFSRGRGFQRTPKDQTLQKQLMKKFRNHRQRMKAAKAAKKAQRGLGMIRSVLSGKKTAAKAALVILKNPITWIGFLVLFVVFLLIAVAGGTTRPAIMQEEDDLTEVWTHMTKQDAKHSDDTNVFYSNLDDVMFYMNFRYEDYELWEEQPGSVLPHALELNKLWKALNGESPDFEQKTMDELIKDKKSKYYMADEYFDEYTEVKNRLGYSTLDGQLVFPFETESLIVTKRYGYDKENGDIVMHDQIEVMTEAGSAFNFPMSGKITKIISSDSVEITEKDTARLTIKGVSSDRLKVGDTVSEGAFLGNTTKEKVTFKYEKFKVKINLNLEEEEVWYTVNPAFYFPSVTYIQTTMLGMSDFAPSAAVEKRAKQVYDYLTKLGYTKEGISAILGNFSVESGINPKRAEGDYLNPPVGASANSWDNPSWLAMGGREIYGKYPNILHRGLGLGQWTDTADGSTRHTLLLNYAKSKNKRWYDLELQLDFIFNGDAPGSRTIAENVAGSKVATNVPELTVYFLTYWEGNPGDKVAERIQAAQNWYNFFSNSGNVVDGSSSEVFEKYKDKMTPLPTDKETKQGQGWEGNAYALGNCTWYVYNRMKQLGKSIHPTMGNANQWVVNYILTPGATLVSSPQRGDVVIFTNGAAGSSSIYGHVAVIEYVNSDGSFVISEMNISGEYSMGWRVLRKEAGEFFMRVK